MKETLPAEIERSSTEAAASGAKFCQELLDEAHEIHERSSKFIEKIKNHIEQGPSKSFLKSNV